MPEWEGCITVFMIRGDNIGEDVNERPAEKEWEGLGYVFEQLWDELFNRKIVLSGLVVN